MNMIDKAQSPQHSAIYPGLPRSQNRVVRTSVYTYSVSDGSSPNGPGLRNPGRVGRLAGMRQTANGQSIEHWSNSDNPAGFFTTFRQLAEVLDPSPVRRLPQICERDARNIRLAPCPILCHALID